MNILHQLGIPVINPKQRLFAKTWKCSRCGLKVRYEKPHTTPGACPVCGGIYWETIK